MKEAMVLGEDGDVKTVSSSLAPQSMGVIYSRDSHFPYLLQNCYPTSMICFFFLLNF